MALTVSPKGPGASTRVPGPGKPSNVNMDRTNVMKPPRLKLLKTRDYGKPQAYPPPEGAGLGFGPTGSIEG